MQTSLLRISAAPILTLLLAVAPLSEAMAMKIFFEASNPQILQGDPFGTLALLGLPGPVPTITGSFSFNVPTPVLSGPTTSNAGTASEQTSTNFQYLDFTVNVGTIALTGSPSVSTINSILVRDGVGASTTDFLRIGSGFIQNLGSGVSLFGLRLDVNAPNTILSNALSVPTFSQLVAMSGGPTCCAVDIDLLAGGTHLLRYDSVTFTSVIPIPPALPFLGSAVGVLALVCRRVATERQRIN